MRDTLLVVDDDVFMHAMYDNALGETYRLVAAENAADAWMLADAEKPQLIILDVEMPGMNGYDICRRFKDADATAAIPVIFVSAKDELEDRLKGFDAGGEDYVIKPFDAATLEAKVALLLKSAAERQNLKSTIAYASTTAMTAMTSLGEMGVLIEALRNFNACADAAALAGSALGALAQFGLQGAVQVRTGADELTLTSKGEASPLEVSVISQMARMERIVQFKAKLSITYEHASLLVDNLPLDDPDRCGRLRDHLAILVEAINVRARTIAAESQTRRQDEAIARAVNRMVETLGVIDIAQRESNVATQVASHRMNESVANILHGIAISEGQEQTVIACVDAGIESILQAQASQGDLQDRLSAIVNELKALREGGAE
jgi:CheY-like chemotaxis protein